MTLTEIKHLLQNNEYDFLRENKYLGSNIAFLTLGGSYAYGTNIDTSDIDIRGCALNPVTDLIGMTNFEQFQNETTDTTIYSFRKLISLLLNCNPNVCELLGCKPEHYFYINNIGQQILDNKKMFLSQRAIYSFGGYANQQLRRLQNALARDTYPQIEKETHIFNSVNAALQSFKDRYSSFENGYIRLMIDNSNQDDMDKEIFADVNLSHYPLRDYKDIWSSMNEIVKDYGKLNKRNNKKDDIHLNKHAMHLVRIYLMCIDILEKEDIITFRSDDHELLMSIRNGEYQRNDSTFISEFWEMINELNKKMDYAASHTSLPPIPNAHMIEEFVMQINKEVVLNYYS